MNKPRIIIEGPPGSGKSAIACIVAKALAAHGIGVKVPGGDCDLPREIAPTLDARVAAMNAREGVVEIVHRQLPRK